MKNTYAYDKIIVKYVPMQVSKVDLNSARDYILSMFDNIGNYYRSTYKK